MTARPSVTEIIEAVSRHTGVPVEQITGKLRTRPIARARALAAYLMRYRRDMSFPEIAKALNYRSHSGPLAAILKQSHEENVWQTANDIGRIIEETRK